MGLNTLTFLRYLTMAKITFKMLNANSLYRKMVGVAQKARASGCGPEGRGFKSHHPPHCFTVGRRQAVRLGTLAPACEGSNPSAPAINE